MHAALHSLLSVYENVATVFVSENGLLQYLFLEFCLQLAIVLRNVFVECWP